MREASKRSRERCSALILNKNGQAMEYRASRSQDPRCQRYSMKGHETCYQHLPLEWKTHYAILERIRAIPDRA